MLGVVAALAALGALVVGADALRRRFLAGTSRPLALLADLVLVATPVVTVSQLLGTVGLLRVAALTPALIGCGLAMWFVGRAGGSDTPTADAGDAVAVVADRNTAVTAAVAIGSIGVLVASWLPRLVDAFRHGPLTIDSMWYHLPIAARFAQSGSTLGLMFVGGGDSLPTFYPHTSELLHAVGIVFLGHDTLTPLLNLGWLAVALLAAWCIGSAFGVSQLSLAGVAMVLGGPQLVMYEAGQGINDLLGIALILAAIAFLATTWRGHQATAGVVVASLATGLALGSRVTVIGPAAVLTICVIAFARAGDACVSARGGSAAWRSPVGSGTCATSSGWGTLFRRSMSPSAR